jgi:aminopeptidase N/puromycin-sensitive aminopeptidase
MKPAGNSQANAKCELMTSKQQLVDLPGCNPWVFADAGAQGYYRTEYDSTAFHHISADAERDFTPAERMVLVRDAWAAVRAGQQPISDFMELAQGLQADRNSAVIRQLDQELDYIGTYLVSDADREQYRAWVRNLLNPIMKDVGWQPTPTDDSNRKDLRAYVFYTLGYTGRDPQVIAKAHELVNAALEKPASVDPSMTDPAFGVAAVDGNSQLYDQLVSKLGKNDNPEQYYRYLYALAHFSDPALLQRTLDYAISASVRNQDSLLLIAAVMRNPAGEKLAWNFVQAHWADIEKLVGGFNTGGLVATTGTFCDASMLDQVKQFFSQHDVPAAERSLRQATENVNYCIDMRSHDAPQLASWLQNQSAVSKGGK